MVRSRSWAITGKRVLRNVRSEKRYRSPCKIYVYVKRGLVIISYSKRMKKEFEKLRSKVTIGLNADEYSYLIGNEFNCSISKEIKFYYN